MHASARSLLTTFCGRNQQVRESARRNQRRGENAQSGEADARELAELKVPVRHDENITALENIILDKVMTALILKLRRSHTSSPTDIGIAAKDDRDGTKYDEVQRISEIAVHMVIRGAEHKSSWGIHKYLNWNWHTKENQFGKGGKDVQREGTNCWSKDTGKKGG